MKGFFSLEFFVVVVDLDQQHGDYESPCGVVSLLSLFSLQSAVCLFALLLSNRGSLLVLPVRRVCVCVVKVSMKRGSKSEIMREKKWLRAERSKRLEK